MDAELVQVTQENKGVELLQKTASEMHLALDEAQSLYDDCALLNTEFQRIRKWLGKEGTNKAQD